VGSLEEGGALAEEEAFINGECSYAHLCRNGVIKRFNEYIGTKKDIEILEDPYVLKKEIDFHRAIKTMCTSPSWQTPEKIS